MIFVYILHNLIFLLSILIFRMQILSPQAMSKTLQAKEDRWSHNHILLPITEVTPEPVSRLS